MFLLNILQLRPYYLITLLYFCLMFRPGESDSDAEDLEHADKLRQVKAVLEEVKNYFPFL